MSYSNRPPGRRRISKLPFILLAIILAVAITATVAVRRAYFERLEPVGNSASAAQLVAIAKGASLDEIALQLQQAGLVRSAWAFRLYVSSKDVRDALQAGTYSLTAGQSVPQIVSQLTHGKIATNLVTILPAQRLGQVRTALAAYGFKAVDIDNALNPGLYNGNPALVDKPAGADLEGYIYPDSYQKDSNTKPRAIVLQALAQMDKRLTPGLRDAFAKQGLSTYEAITLASIVEQEVSNQNDRAQAAQVFLKRLRSGQALGSDVTAYYGAAKAGQRASVLYDSPYNTRLHKGLPPGPISNVSASSLEAVAHPAATDWLYFVAGDDGTTHFTRTLQEHEAATAQYCHKLCQE